jgi:hypothetical protein
MFEERKGMDGKAAPPNCRSASPTPKMESETKLAYRLFVFSNNKKPIAEIESEFEVR